MYRHIYYIRNLLKYENADGLQCCKLSHHLKSSTTNLYNPLPTSPAFFLQLAPRQTLRCHYMPGCCRKEPNRMSCGFITRKINQNDPKVKPTCSLFCPFNRVAFYVQVCWNLCCR